MGVVKARMARIALIRLSLVGAALIFVAGSFVESVAAGSLGITTKSTIVANAAETQEVKTLTERFAKQSAKQKQSLRKRGFKFLDDRHIVLELENGHKYVLDRHYLQRYVRLKKNGRIKSFSLHARFPNLKPYPPGSDQSILRSDLVMILVNSRGHNVVSELERRRQFQDRVTKKHYRGPVEDIPGLRSYYGDQRPNEFHIVVAKEFGASRFFIFKCTNKPTIKNPLCSISIFYFTGYWMSISFRREHLPAWRMLLTNLPNLLKQYRTTGQSDNG